MNHRTKTASILAIALLAGSGIATAQYTGPSPAPKANATTSSQPAGGYAGPSSVPVMTVKQVLETGKDDQHVRLKGRIVSHDGGSNYTFADETGRMPIEISAKRFPPNQPIGADTVLEITAEIDKDFRKMELEVEQIRVVTQ